MRICPDCAEELIEVRVVSHIYYRCYKCDTLFVEKGKGAFFKCRELTSFTELSDNGRKPDACDVCEKQDACRHVGFSFYGCRSIDGAELKTMTKEGEYWHFTESVEEESAKAHQLFGTKEEVVI
jgi:ribosomal protein L37AE/L43A